MRRLALGVAALVLAAGCGQSGTPADRALRSTAKHLDDIRSATLALRMTATNPLAKAPVGFALAGKFALPDRDGLPVADVTVTELRGGKTYASSFVSTGQAAYVVSGSRVTALPAGAGVSVGGANGGLGTLRIDHWLRDPVLADGGDVGGVPTDRVSAGLEVATAFDDLGRLGARLGASTLAALRPLDEKARTQLAASARDSSIEVWTGKHDRLLRRLRLTVTLTAASGVPVTLRSFLPVTLAFTLDLSDLNRPVHVDPPKT